MDRAGSAGGARIMVVRVAGVAETKGSKAVKFWGPARILEIPPARLALPGAAMPARCGNDRKQRAPP